MRRRVGFGLVAVWVLLISVSIAVAADTSAYLIGTWEDDGYDIITDFVIVNPTTIQLDVYAAFFWNDGTPTGVCYKNSLKPNAKWFIPGYVLDLYYNQNNNHGDIMGTAKFITLPTAATGAKRTVIDQNAVIGGFQNRWFGGFVNVKAGQTAFFALDGYCPSISQADLKGVTINLYTAGELTKVVNDKICLIWNEFPVTSK